VTGETLVFLAIGEVVGEGTFGDEGLGGFDLFGLLEANSEGSSTICDPSMILGEVDDGSVEMTIEGAVCFISMDSCWVPYLENTSILLTLRRPAARACIDLRRADMGELLLLVASEADCARSVPGEEDASVGVPLRISRLR
jgi:hypothetical protein